MIGIIGGFSGLAIMILMSGIGQSALATILGIIIGTLITVLSLEYSVKSE